MKKRSSPKLAAAVNEIKSMIRRENLKPGDRLPTKAVLCDKTGCSQMTVQRAVKYLCEDGKLITVRGGGIYVAPSRRAKKSIPIVYTAFKEASGFSKAIEGAKKYFSAHGFETSILPVKDCTDMFSTVKKLSSQGHKSIIVMHLDDNDDTKRYFDIIRSGTRLIFIDTAPREFCTDFVSCDNITGGFLATEHLILEGCRNIAYMEININNWMLSGAERFEGYKLALAKYGISFRKELCQTVSGEPGEKFDALMSLKNRPDGFFCVNDFMAGAVENLALANGLSVPQDVAIVGFDDLELAKNMPVPLSSVRQDFYALGAEAAKLCMEKGQNGVFKKVCLPVGLAVKESSRKKNTKT